MRITSFRRAAILTLLAGAMGTSACFGSFNLTRKVWSFNKKVSDEKFVQELLFLGMNIVPVYSVAGFIDAVVANTVEFWTGKNPISMASTIKLDSVTTVKRYVMEKDGVRVMTLKAFKFDKLVATTTIEHMPGTSGMTFETVYADGRTEQHVAMVNAEGKAVVSSAAYAVLPRAGVKVGE